MLSLSWIGSAVAALGAALIIIWLGVTPFKGGVTTWHDKTYSLYYLLLAVSAVVFLVISAITRVRRFALVGMALALVTCGSSVDTAAFLYGDLEQVNGAFWLQPIGGLILAAGGLLAYLGHDFEPAPATQPAAPERVPAGREEEAPAGVPAGWYPDPAGGGGQRYWDGSRWADETSG
jgi:Protein of unknown function (DUF2510)